MLFISRLLLFVDQAKKNTENKIPLNMYLPYFFQSVAANGVVGSLDQNQNSEDCAACMKGQCRGYNGLYTRSDLPAGYSLVAEIPQGACRISIQQLKHTKNVIGKNGFFQSFVYPLKNHLQHSIHA